MSSRNLTPMLFILFGLILAGFNDREARTDEWLYKVTPKKADAFARSYIEILRQHDIETAISLLNPDLNNSETQSTLFDLSKVLDHGVPLSIKIVSANVIGESGEERSDLAYEVKFNDAWAVVNVVVDSGGGIQQIAGIHVIPLDNSLKETNALTLSGKPMINFIAAFLAVVVPIFIIVTLIICFRTKVSKKWLWIIFILVGVVEFRLNWTTGQWDIFPLSLHFLGVSIKQATVYVPWVLSVCIPLGAIVFLSKRQELADPGKGTG